MTQTEKLTAEYDLVSTDVRETMLRLTAYVKAEQVYAADRKRDGDLNYGITGDLARVAADLHAAMGDEWDSDTRTWAHYR